MIRLTIKSSWDDMIKMLLEADPRLTLEDVNFQQGEDEALVRKLSGKLNLSLDEISGWVESVSSNVVKAY